MLRLCGKFGRKHANPAVRGLKRTGNAYQVQGSAEAAAAAAFSHHALGPNHTNNWGTGGRGTASSGYTTKEGGEARSEAKLIIIFSHKGRGGGGQGSARIITSVTLLEEEAPVKAMQYAPIASAINPTSSKGPTTIDVPVSRIADAEDLSTLSVPTLTF